MYPAVSSNQFEMLATSHLPKLTLLTFSGDPLTWQTFWDSFYVAMHGNPNLSDIKKFKYLKPQYYYNGMQLEQLLAFLSQTQITNMLLHYFKTDNYSQHHKIANSHMQALLEMFSPSNSLSSLRMFYDTIESHIWVLSSLGKSEHSYGDLLIPIIKGKLTTT